MRIMSNNDYKYKPVCQYLNSFHLQAKRAKKWSNMNEANEKPMCYDYF